ncbi:MAG TPA: exodeoxyribonuclease VII large subunit [Eubacterium sp.]|nr:exodeoxyribonuclease VII large subunit [Eubacterium sp.]
MEKSIYSVKQLNSYIKNILETDPFLKSITVQGEVGNCNYHGSGHIYFTIKENTDVINCIMWKGNASKLKFRMEPGQQIVIKGYVGVYEAQGKYQLYANEIEPAGLGDLYQKYEKLKAELEERGLFSDMYKKPIPKYSLKIGVATSETGAVINDIINVTSRRNKFVQLYLKPTAVQGELAAQSIVNSIKFLDEQDLDVIIVGRGGGSLEDLWCFNEEIVAQAIFDCQTPIISAVGHETDFSISDFVADLRAPTPSAAAELAVFEYDEFVNTLERYKATFRNYIDTKIDAYKNKTEVYESKIEKFSPMSKLNTYKQLISEYRDKLSYGFNDKFAETKRLLPEYKNNLSNFFNDKFIRRKHTLQLFIEKLEGLSPLEKISRGFAYVSGADGPIVSTKDVDVGDDISLIIKDGKIDAKVSGKQDGEIYGKE